MKLVDLSGKRALVGGSTDGIGKGIALLFAELGAEVVLFARNEEKLKETIKEMKTPDKQKHTYLVADFVNSELVKERVLEYISKHGSFDIVVNNTGGPPGGLISEAEEDAFILAFTMHLVNNQNIAKLVFPHMKEKKWGRFINIISSSVREPINGLGVSNTTRGAVASWAKTLSNELAPYNITVNNLLPGFIKTGRLYSIVNSRAEKSGRDPKEIEQEMVNMVPMGRFAETREIANAAAFLASPAASYITGVSLQVDGGRLKSI
ncbi:MAG: SDR family oxidoreductase [Candidatus Heimdallarchaeota archaeon]|nr:SDR family oxidoreductase [Candidatus Heimdallarchaeota archaeon]